MVKELILKVEESFLKLSVKKNNDIYWCTLYIKTDNSNDYINIGSDSVDIICKKINDGLQNTELKSSNILIDNKQVCWIITLLETYISMFIFRNLDGIILYFIDDSKNIKGKLKLNNLDISYWLNKILRFEKEFI
jgi:hypothetical protein